MDSEIKRPESMMEQTGMKPPEDASQTPAGGAAPQLPQKKKKGCFFYGCLTLIVLTVLASIGGIFLYRKVVGAIVAYIEPYTETTPLKFPEVKLSSARRQELQNRINSFAEALKEDKSPSPLILTADEINAFLRTNPGAKEFANMFHIKIEDGVIKGTVSLPLKKLASLPGLGELKDRYINGEAGIKAELENGVLIVTLDSLEVKGKILPDEFMEEMRKHNFAQDAYKDVETAELMKKLQSIRVDGNKIILTPR